jgi:hypothetical protein
VRNDIGCEGCAAAAEQNEELDRMRTHAKRRQPHVTKHKQSQLASLETLDSRLESRLESLDSMSPLVSSDCDCSLMTAHTRLPMFGAGNPVQTLGVQPWEWLVVARRGLVQPRSSARQIVRQEHVDHAFMTLLSRFWDVGWCSTPMRCLSPPPARAFAAQLSFGSGVARILSLFYAHKRACSRVGEDFRIQ